jgi:D-glycero-alpha-D-manno-heptose-7-phosphate kinase
VSRSLVARAPTRLDFGGGWTDVAPYCDERGGAVCNLAIARYATATVALGDGADGGPVSAGRASNDPLVQAALRSSDISGATAIVASDFPVGAGLGGSSAAGVALAGALAALAGSPLDPASLAERSRRTEVEELGIAGGFQDHYAAAYGGALLLTAGAPVHVERLELPDDIAGALTRRVVLVYTGESRVSTRTVAAVADLCRAGDRGVCRALDAMKGLAFDMAAALRAGDLDALGTLVGEHWAHQRRLHPSISTARIDAIHGAAMMAGALGMKALGASGGGCVMAFARDGREDELAAALETLGERMTFVVDRDGFEVVARLEGRDESPDEDG